MELVYIEFNNTADLEDIKTRLISGLKVISLAAWYFFSHLGIKNLIFFIHLKVELRAEVQIDWAVTERICSGIFQVQSSWQPILLPLFHRSPTLRRNPIYPLCHALSSNGCTLNEKFFFYFILLNSCLTAKFSETQFLL